MMSLVLTSPLNPAGVEGLKLVSVASSSSGTTFSPSCTGWRSQTKASGLLAHSRRMRTPPVCFLPALPLPVPASVSCPLSDSPDTFIILLVVSVSLMRTFSSATLSMLVQEVTVGIF